MFHVHWEECIFCYCWVGGSVCACQVYLVYSSVQVLYSLIDLLSSCSMHYWKWGIEISNYYCRIVYLSLQFCQCFHHIFWDSVVRSIFVYIIISSWWIAPFMNISQCLVTIFYLKSILFVVSIYSHPALFWLLFAWNIFFYPFIFSLFVSLGGFPV